MMTGTSGYYEKAEVPLGRALTPAQQAKLAVM
jgi:hypothetical protein